MEEVETRTLDWFLDQRQRDLKKEGSDQRIQAVKETLEKRAAEQKHLHEKIRAKREIRVSILRQKEALSSFELIHKSIERTRKTLVEFGDRDIVRMLDELTRKAQALEGLVLQTVAKKEESNATKNPEEERERKPSYPRVV